MSSLSIDRQTALLPQHSPPPRGVRERLFADVCRFLAEGGVVARIPAGATGRPPVRLSAQQIEIYGNRSTGARCNE